MSYLRQANELMTDLLQFAQHIETITGEPTWQDFHALTRVSELSTDLCDAVAAYQSEALNEKRQLMEAYPKAYEGWLNARRGG